MPTYPMRVIAWLTDLVQDSLSTRSRRMPPMPKLNSIVRGTWVIACLCIASCADESGERPAEAASGVDTVLINGRIYTVDDERPWADAVAIDRGRFVYVGSAEGAESYIGSETTVVDLGERLVLPGFQDAHIHPIGAGIEASACNLNDLPGLDAYRTVIGDYAASNPDVDWVLGGGWLMSVFGPGGAPDKALLDELVPDRPVFLTSADGHSAWVNSRALAIAGIDRDTPDPPDGRIDRDPETGEPIGALQEGAMSLVSRHIPETTAAMREAGLRYAVELLNGYGITSIQDANVNAASLSTYRALESAGELSLRVVGSIWWDRERGLEQIDDILALRERFADADSLVRPVTVKIMQDGVMENYTAALLEPYLVPGGTRGIPMVDPELLGDAVTALDAEGFQVHFHAIGDAAIRQSLDGVEQARLTNGASDHRHHISHLQLIDPDDIPRFAELEVVANFQPLWAYADEYITELTAPYLGEARMRWMYPIRSVREAGGRLAFGSDWSVSTANPFPQIETALRRVDPFDEAATLPFIPEERIALEDAIAAFTINAAFVNHQDDETGSIEVGKHADLAVLDLNLFDVDPARISETRVVVTLFGGEVVHGALQDL